MKRKYIFPILTNLFWFNVVFQLLFTLSESKVGIYLTSTLVYIVILGYLAYSWYLKQFNKIIAETISIDLDEVTLFVLVNGTATNSIGHRPYIKYSYDIDGKTYTNSRFTPYKNDKYYTDKNKWNKYLKRISKNKHLPVYYNPKNISQSYATVAMSNKLKVELTLNLILASIASTYAFITI